MKISAISGPWSVVEHSWQDTSVAAGDKTICLLHMDDEEVTEENQDEQLAQQLSNAKLIAAAPELLNALQLLVDSQSLKGSLIHAIENAMNVIKKATE